MKVEDGVGGTSSSTGMAQGDSNQAAPKQAGSKKKAKKSKKGKKGKKKY